tara:strand:- start:615 stop:869 length:255 start_codon:yes stop_codon:yes gene_type:complete
MICSEKLKTLIVIKKSFLLGTIISFIFCTNVSAYIGPGLALGTVVLTLGVVAVLLLAILAILYYPIKKMIKNIKLKKLKKDKQI